MTAAIPDPHNDPFHPGGFIVYYGSEAGVGGAGVSWIAGPRASMPIIRTTVIAVGSAGDMNGDGYGDVIVGDPFDQNGRGSVYGYGGSSRGLGAVPTVTIPWVPTSGLDSRPGFGRVIQGLGDIDGDRLADVLVVSDDRSASFVLGALGSMGRLAQTVRPVDPASDPGLSFGVVARTAPDLDGDGDADVVIPCRLCVGHVYIYRGPFTDTSVPTWSLREGSESNFGGAVNDASDFDGDGYDDLSIWDSQYLQPIPFPGVLHIYRGGAQFSRQPSGLIGGEDFPEFTNGRGIVPRLVLRVPTPGSSQRLPGLGQQNVRAESLRQCSILELATSHNEWAPV